LMPSAPPPPPPPPSLPPYVAPDASPPPPSPPAPCADINLTLINGSDPCFSALSSGPGWQTYFGVALGIFGGILLLCCALTLTLVALRHRGFSRGIKQVSKSASSESPVASAPGRPRSSSRRKQTTIMPSCEPPGAEPVSVARAQTRVPGERGADVPLSAQDQVEVPQPPPPPPPQADEGGAVDQPTNEPGTHANTHANMSVQRRASRNSRVALPPEPPAPPPPPGAPPADPPPRGGASPRSLPPPPTASGAPPPGARRQLPPSLAPPGGSLAPLKPPGHRPPPERSS